MATIQATEEGYQCIMAGRNSWKGINDNTVSGLPHEAVLKFKKKYNRIKTNRCSNIQKPHPAGTCG